MRNNLILLFLLWIGWPAAVVGSEFILNGKPIVLEWARVLGDGTEPQPGDVVYINNQPLVLRPALSYEFATDAKKPGTVWLVSSRPARLVGIELVRTAAQQTLENLSDEDLAGLWGVAVRRWDESVASVLARIDSKTTAVKFEAGESDGPKSRFGQMQKLPALVKELRYLAIDQTSWPGLSNLTTLASSRELLYCSVSLSFTKDSAPFEPTLLAGNQGLRHLKVRGLMDTAWPTGGFPKLHSLDLAWNADVTNVIFLRQLPKLQTLRLDRTQVVDLSPMESLGQLQELYADLTPIQKLPEERMNSLKLVRLMGTKLTAKQVAQFAQMNPQAEVWFDWVKPFVQALQKVTQVRVRSGGTCHRNLEKEKLLAQVSDAREIQDLMAAIEIEENQTGFHCMCCGDATLEFYAGDKLVVMLGLHHGRSVRWPERWPADAMLTGRGSKALAAWMEKHRIAVPNQR